METPQESLAEVQASIVTTRKQVLDLLELAFRDHPQWSYVRSRVLRALGRSGLEGVLSKYLDSESPRDAHGGALKAQPEHGGGL
ncbi:hypothetical protein WDW37_13950 [Bdellovibrionota bacterium FG-1]